METDKRLRELWRDASGRWIDRVSHDEDPNRVGLLDQVMLDVVGDVSGLRVLDLGCGEGRFSRMLAERGAHVTGIDFCESFVDYALEHRVHDEKYLVGDMSDLSAFSDETFDLVVAYLTLIELPDAAQALRDAYRVLRVSRRAVVCDVHPMCSASAAWVRDESGNKLHFKLDNYFDEGPRDLQMYGKLIVNFHRSLSTSVKSFLSSGFRLDGIIEPKPTTDQLALCPDMEDNLRVPNFIIYVLAKR